MQTAAELAARRDEISLEKLSRLRAQMRERGLDAYLVPSVDEHINEYLPKDKERRAWVSGFTGSAGDFFVSHDEAWVYADSRYHEQVDYEVSSHVKASKLGLDGHLTLTEQLRKMAEGKECFRIGFDPFTLTVLQHRVFEKAFENTSIELVPVTGNLVDPLWTEDRPESLRAEVYSLPETVTGASLGQKLTTLREKMKKAGADVLPLTKLDQIAWLFNLRGQDIPYNPLFIAYAIVTEGDAWLFTDDHRLTQEARESLSGHAKIQPYDSYLQVLQSEAKNRAVLLHFGSVTQGTLQQVKEAGGKIVEAENPVDLMKAVKNPTEIACMQRANLRASRAKIRAWYWLEEQLKAGVTVTEETFRQAIERCYAEEPEFMGLSFNTISGAGSNSSIVHYGTPDPNKVLERNQLFLIDSGAQYWGGTTDDTRTMIIGEADALQKQRFTAVLKAHIACADQMFPKGTEGARLDGITRSTMWQAGLDYGHGTGHGVGAFLNVHEGPNGIHRMASKPFEPGMVTSIEPGYYEPGWGGIRLENLYLCVELETGVNGTRWYGFESLTYVPFDKRLIDFEALSADHLAWLRNYNAAILEKIGPTLEADELAWLREICAV